MKEENNKNFEEFFKKKIYPKWTDKAEWIKEDILKFSKRIYETFNIEDTEKIFDALGLMIELHSKQKDRVEGKPYINHPLENAYDLLDKYGIKDRDIIIGTLLHDIIEDQNLRLIKKYNEISYEELENMFKEELEEQGYKIIENKFGSRVKEMVKGVTNPDLYSKIKEDLSEKERIIEKNKAYKKHIEEIMKYPDVFIVKFADLMRNKDIYKMPEGHPKREKLRKKYGIIIKEVLIPRIKKLEENHPLYPKKEDIIKELEDAYKTHFSNE